MAKKIVPGCWDTILQQILPTSAIKLTVLSGRIYHYWSFPQYKESVHQELIREVKDRLGRTFPRYIKLAFKKLHFSEEWNHVKANFVLSIQTGSGVTHEIVGEFRVYPV